MNISSTNENVQMSVGLRLGANGASTSDHRGIIDANGFTLTNQVWAHDRPHTESNYDAVGITQEQSSLVALALTDVAYANLDELVAVIDEFQESPLFGRNDPGTLSQPTLNECKKIIQGSVAEALQTNVWKLLCFTASRSKPGRMLYRIREAVLNASSVSYNVSTKKLSVTLPDAYRNLVTNKSVAKATVEWYLLQEAKIQPLGTGFIQVLPVNSLTKRLAESGDITVTVNGRDEALVKGDYGASGLPDGFDMPDVVLGGGTTYEGPFNSESLETLEQTSGTQATISLFTAKQVRVQAMYAKLATQSHAENARALSIFYAGLHQLPKLTKKNDFGDAATVAAVETAANAAYLFSTVLALQYDALLQEADAKKQIDCCKTRSMKTAIGSIWSFNTSKAIEPHVPVLGYIANRRTELLAEVATSYGASGEWDPYIPMTIDEGLVNVVIATDPEFFTTDATATSHSTGEYDGAIQSRAGYKGIKLSNMGYRMYPDADYAGDSVRVIQFLWFDKSNSYTDPDSLYEAIRSDSESEWAAAVRGITPTGLAGSKSCDPCPWLVAGGVVGGIALANKKDDKAQDAKPSVIINTQTAELTSAKGGSSQTTQI